jgi:hypothetical protein
MDTHQAEGIRTVRAPIVVRPKADVSIIVRFFSWYVARGIATIACGVLVEEDPREEVPTSFKCGRGRAGALVRYHQDVKLRFADRAFGGRRKHLFTGGAVVDLVGCQSSRSDRTRDNP